MISYLPSILSFWYCALASKTYKYLSIYLGRYLDKYLYVLLTSVQDQKDSIVGKYKIIPTRIDKLCLKDSLNN